MLLTSCSLQPDKCFFGRISCEYKQDKALRKETMTRQNSKKRILILTNHSYMLWQFRRELIIELLSEHTVYLCMPYVGHEDDFKQLGAKCVKIDLDRRSKNPFKDLKLLTAYRSVIRKVQPDLVITYSIKPNIYGGVACQLCNIPYYANVQGLGTAFQGRRLAHFAAIMYRHGLRKAVRVFFENAGNAAEFSERGIVEPDRQIILNGAGVNLEYFSYSPYPENGCFHFLYLGRIMKEKGIDELFEAAGRLWNDYTSAVEGHGSEGKENRSFVLDVVGFFEEPYEEQVRELEEKGIIRFHGFRTDPRPYYKMADCIVMPSYHEGMSNVNLEAAAVGRPVITTDIPGCREAVDDGVTGLLCRKKDADSLYSCMKRMLRIQPSERQDMGRRARQKAEAEFNRRDIVKLTVRTLFDNPEEDS